jgi:antitoxin component YwqK of YwqJK toxin-antitoxin module
MKIKIILTSLLIINSLLVSSQLTINENLLFKKDGLFTLNNINYSGNVHSFFNNGQIKSNYVLVDGKMQGIVQIYHAESNFKSSNYRDTLMVSEHFQQIDKIKSELKKNGQDSIVLNEKRNRYILEVIGGDKKLIKLRSKYVDSKLKGNKRVLYDELLKIENSQINLLNSSIQKRYIIDSLENMIKKELEKPFFSPVVRYKFEMNNNQNSGVFIEYNSSGGALIEGSFLNDKKEGVWTYYYFGKIKSKGNYKNGLQDGEWVYYFPNGKQKAKGKFFNGDEGNVSEASGIPRNGREGIWISFYENGQLSQESIWKSGLQNGSQRYYYENGNLNELFSCKNGLLNGNYKKYFENGKLQKELEYVEGKIVGKVLEYFDNGQLKGEGLANPDGATWKYVKRFNIDGSAYKSFWYTKQDEYDNSKEIYAFTNCKDYTCPRIVIWGKNDLLRWSLLGRNDDYLNVSTSPKKYSSAIWYIKENGENVSYSTDYSNLSFIPLNVQDALKRGEEVTLKIGNNPNYYSVSLSGYTDAINWLNK